MIMSQPVPTALTDELGSEVLAQCLQGVDDPLRPRLVAMLYAALTYGAEQAQAWRGTADGAPNPLSAPQQALVVGGAALGALLLLVEADRAVAATAGWQQLRPPLVAQWTALRATAAPPAQAAALVQAMTVTPTALPYLQSICQHYLTLAAAPSAAADGWPRPGDTLH